ncbi:hypothetical protein JCM8547_007565 [Rhodosporidiobolus lusitaniae]
MFSSWFRSAAPASAQPQEIRVKELWVYPIKSCRGTSVHESAYTEEGFLYDRQWMIVEEGTHKFLTARTIPKMVLIHPVINYTTQTLDIFVPSPPSSSSLSSEKEKPSSAGETFSIPLAHPSSDPSLSSTLDHDFSVWGCDPQDGFIVQHVALTSALSAFMGRSVLLIRKGLTRRSVADVPGVVHSEGLDPVLGFADFYSFLIASQTSLSELTSRIPSLSSHKSFNASRWSKSAIAERGGLEITRFRANILVEGVKEAWEEDGWKRIRIGGGGKEGEEGEEKGEGEGEVFEVGFRCARCMLPSVDPSTAVRDPLLPDAVMLRDRACQPLSAPKVCFGMLSSPLKKDGGRVRVGDRVSVEEAYERPARGGPWVRDEDRV